MIQKDDYNFKKSSNKLKKYDAYKNGKKIASFGAIRKDGKPYEQFFDKIGLYSDYNHNSEKRKNAYFARHKKTYPKESADWFSKKYLW
ncbi:MAG: hypothetical protein H6630_08900 [Arcobacter sp.]|nr:hypothetical protein [Arcobacter sp.]